MASLARKLMVSCLGLAFVLAAAPADADQARKHKKPRPAHTAAVEAKNGYRGANLFPAGPVYHGNDYLGDDPDPFIRLQLQRDIGAHYGGEP
ncbi:MAG TPA: hypothetical protein VFW22_11575 [Pseudolabrys sp.]|nr:hypothetical protein [Pseudolabrys sp.]